MAYAIDRQAISTKAEFGYVQAASQTGLVLPGQKDWLDSSIPNQGLIPYDIKQATDILDKAGYKKDSSGKLTTLQVGTVNKVKTSGLTFLVSATNGGNYTEFNVPVKITIGSGDTKVQKTATIPQITRGATETVSISGFDSGPQLPYGPAVKMHVLVTPVPGERTASNNSQTFQIIFSL